MKQENIGKFEQLLVSDAALQAKIRAAMDAYTGDRKDERAVFDAVIKPLAEEAGLSFTYEEGRGFVSESRELSDDELEHVAGGVSYCWIVGAGSARDVGESSDAVAGGVGACQYIGVGLGGFGD